MLLFGLFIMGISYHLKGIAFSRSKFYKINVELIRGVYVYHNIYIYYKNVDWNMSAPIIENGIGWFERLCKTHLKIKN